VEKNSSSVKKLGPARYFLLITLHLVFLLTVGFAQPLVVAHRGGTALGPENRLSTFQEAIALKVDAIELDIHQSKDGALMVIHDNTLDRTFGRPGRVDRMTRQELVEIGVPTLEQAVDLAKGRCRLVVEIKHPHGDERHEGIEKRLVELLRTKNVVQETIVISFDKKSLVTLHKLAPELTTGYLFATPGYPLDQARAELGVTYVGPYYLLATPAFIGEAHKAGLKVNPWTVNQASGMRLLIESDCDAITTNEPALLQSEMKKVPVRAGSGR